MRDRGVEIPHDAHREFQRQELGCVVLLARLFDPGKDRHRLLVPDELYAAQGRCEARQSDGGDCLVNKERLHRVAHARSLKLGVDDDALGHVQIRRRIDVDVAVPVSVDHIRHGRLVNDQTHERWAAAGDEAVDDPAQLHELGDGLVTDVLDELDRVDW